MPFDEAHVSVATHALHYGTAAFAGMRANPDKKVPGNIALFRPELHTRRLSDSAHLLSQEVSPEQITEAITRFIAANPAEPYYLRPLLYASDLGIAPRLHDIEFDLLIYGVKMGDYVSADGITCCISSWTRGEDRSIPLRGKISGTYVSSALAKTEAVERGYDEAIFLNSRGKVAEGSAMNIFMVKSGELITPTVTSDILEGITRRSVIELANDLKLTVVEREIDRSELLLADEVFLTGTAARIAPITKIEQYMLPAARPVTKKINDALTQIVEQRSDTHQDWIVSFPASS